MLKFIGYAGFALFLLCSTHLSAQDPPRAASSQQILAEGTRTAEAQIQALAGKAPIDWVGAVMWTGMMDLYRADAPRKEGILQALIQAGNSVRWTPILNPKNPFFADDYCFGQAVLDVADARSGAVELTPLQWRCESLAPYLEATAGDARLLTWSWCDALFMAPAVLARWSEHTKDPLYRNAMNTEWWKVSAVLYDPTEHLYYRDDRFLPSKKLSRNGRKVFWARGNGWVLAGLTRVLSHLPKDYPDYPKYVAQFQELSEKLASLQRPDGTWSSSLLDPEETPASEFSGTAFYCAAMAWGIREGILDRAKFLPVAARAWAALLAMRRADGLPGYVQVVADSPGKVSPDGTQLYATGGFCMAAAAMAQLAPFDLPPAPTLTEAP